VTLQVYPKVEDKTSVLCVSVRTHLFTVWKARRERCTCGAVRMPIDLYHIVGSPPCHSVRLLLKTIGVGVNLKSVDLLKDEHKTPEFVKVGRFRTHASLQFT
jgi:hypothetical protein